MNVITGIFSEQELRIIYDGVKKYGAEATWHSLVHQHKYAESVATVAIKHAVKRFHRA